jgi:hypothetical protein
MSYAQILSMKNRIPGLLCALFLSSLSLSAQNVGINADGSLPNTKAMLDISSTNKGLLIPRMSTAERNAISNPPTGLQVYNTTTNKLDIYKGTIWEEVAWSDSSVILVRTLADLPAPTGTEIRLDSTKSYKFSGLVNISPNYLNANGAALLGTNPIRDGVLSNVSGAIIRSTDMHVYIEKMLIVPFSAATSAFNFSDGTGTRSCNLLSGINIKDAGTASQGVGQISGFRAVIALENYWNTAQGIKLSGRMGRFVCGFTLIGSITTGAGIEFNGTLNADDVDLSNCHFIYTGNTGVKLTAGALVNRGRMTTNMFRGPATFLDGFDSYSTGWEMQQNTNIPNSRAYSFAYMNGNATATNLPVQDVYYKIAGNTTSVSEKRFSHTVNRFTYTNVRPMTARVFVVIGGKSPANGTEISIALAKNGVIIPFPNSTLGSLTNNQGFQVSLETEVDMVTGDYIEVFLKRNNSIITSLTVSDLQFRVRE